MATMDFSMYGRQNTLMDYMNADKDRALKQRMGEQDIAAQQQNMEMNKYKVEQDKLNNALQLLSSVSDEGSYQTAKQIASQRLGMDVSTLPPNYDPNWVASTQNQLLSAKERMDMAWEKQKFSQTLGETARHNRAIEDKPAGLGGQVAAQIMAENPGMGFTEAYLLGTAKQGQGMTWNPQTRRMELMQGAAPAAQDMSYAKATGTNLSDLQYKPLVAGESQLQKDTAELKNARELQSEKKLGEQYPDTATGAKVMESNISTLDKLYDALDKGGGIVSTEKGVISNLGASVRSSPVGQYAGKKTGTETQSIRNQIKIQRPALINAIRQATGMSSKAMDSNAELQFYLQMATDPDQYDVQSNRAALKYLKDTYGVGGAMMQKFGDQVPSSAEPSKVDFKSKYGLK